VRKLCGLLLLASPLYGYTFDEAQAFLNTYCRSCHSGKSPVAGFNVTEVSAAPSLGDRADRWTRIALRLRNNEMPPPRSLPAPPLDEREHFVKWIDESLHAEACAAGPVAGFNPIRRLNRAEYTATARELLDIHLNVGHDLPADGAGGQGFDNAAEVLFLSPVLAEKYMDAAKQSLEFAVRDSRARARIGIVEPGGSLSAIRSAHKILESFLPRAFRRPVDEKEMEPFLALFREAQKQHQTFDSSVIYMLRGVLMSPQFLFRVEAPNPGPEPRLLDDYALASRLSYFLWGSMPDEMMFDLAALGKLHEPAVLKEEIGRMLRSGKSRDFIESFVTQWLGTRELGREFVPDAKIFPNYASDADLRGDIRFQPILFFHTMLSNNAPVTDLIDSNWTIITKKLVTLYGFDKSVLRKDNQEQPHRIELPPDSHRGGLLGMSAVLAVSSYPYRTSPVLRGKWVLDAILGSPPPPPPPNVPTLPEHAGAQPQTMRERLAQHRENPVCASCHSRIDPIGFALENYDALGQWRTEDAGKPIDNSGELPDGTKFEGSDQLKAVLLEKKDLFLRNLTSRMLGYALGRGLTRQDSCTVDSIMAQLAANDYKSQALIEAIVMSPPFRYQAGASVRKEKSIP
jgi:Protein of unknown function (DUF1588)/Protein of unknown function (DUF1592)/Protein of unknown function (DUF1585)/Protein of unknown function (DUF1587)/Protein of unknown function (DUF1595)